MSTALLPNTLSPKEKLAGFVHFKKNKKGKYRVVYLIVGDIAYGFDVLKPE